MMGKWKHSIRGQLIGIIMLVSAAAVLLACAASIAQDVVDEREELAEQMLSFGRLLAADSDAPLAFGDQQAAREGLAVLRSKASFVAGGVYTEHDLPFATYSDGTVTAPPRVPRGANRLVRRDGLVELFLPITRDGARVGTVYIASDQRDLHARMKQDALFTLVIFLVCGVLTFMLSSSLEGRITGPIVDLARVADSVSQHKDYTVRAEPRGPYAGDEVADLVNGFNNMLAEIEQREDSLLEYQTHLEDTVALRTGELTTANEELILARNAAETVAETNQRLARDSALILNNATEGIVGIGLDGRPTFLNPAGARMFGMTLDDLGGRSLHEAIHHSHPDGTPWSEEDCGNTRSIARGESLPLGTDVFWRKDGTSFPVEYSSTPMVDEEGHQRGAVMMFRDVTERRAVEKLKSEFVSTVSHELRTPLTSIRGSLGLLSSGLLGPVSEKAQRMLEIAVNNTDRLVRLINDMLDLERIDSGKVELDRGRVDANAVMLQAAEGLQPMADQAGVHLVVVPATGGFQGDSDRIIQTLTNLLGNAIKFSPADTTVTLSGAAGETDFAFSVADQGRGVPAEKLESIFGRFSQVDASDSRDKGGTGLGLAICRSIVQAHGGRIWAENNEPAGTRFRFTIPLAVPSTVSPVGTASPATETIPADQSGQSTDVVETLERGGFRVVKATSSADVLAQATGLIPDAVILDVADGNGREIVEALKATDRTRDIPIVLVAGRVAESYESYAAAVADWVRTPLKSDGRVEDLEQARTMPSILVVEDDLDLARVMTAALQRQGIRTFHAATGREAVQLCRQQEPSLIVLDLVLPDMDGFAVVDSLRGSPTLGRVPLLVYSALDVGSADQSRLRLGPTEFLTKSRDSLAEFERHVVRLLDTVTSMTKEGRDVA